MKRHWIATFVTLLTLALLAGALIAAETKDRRKPGAKPDGRKQAGRRPGGAGRMPDIGLTDEQKAAMAKIRKDAMAKIKDAKPEERKAIFEEMRKQIEALLTAEQLEKLKQARQGGQRGRGMPDIGLTDEQKTKIEKIRKEAMAAAKDAKPEARKGILEQMRKDIHALLTDEQIEKLKKAQQGGPRDGAKVRGDRKGRRPGGAKGRKGGGDRPGKKRPASE